MQHHARINHGTRFCLGCAIGVDGEITSAAVQVVAREHIVCAIQLAQACDFCFCIDQNIGHFRLGFSAQQHHILSAEGAAISTDVVATPNQLQFLDDSVEIEHLQAQGDFPAVRCVAVAEAIGSAHGLVTLVEDVADRRRQTAVRTLLVGILRLVRCGGRVECGIGFNDAAIATVIAVTGDFGIVAGAALVIIATATAAAGSQQSGASHSQRKLCQAREHLLLHSE